MARMQVDSQDFPYLSPSSLIAAKGPCLLEHGLCLTDCIGGGAFPAITCPRGQVMQMGCRWWVDI